MVLQLKLRIILFISISFFEATSFSKSCCCFVKSVTKQKVFRLRDSHRDNLNGETGSSPVTQNPKISSSWIVGGAIFVSSLIARPKVSRAIGDLFELKDQSVVIQDVGFNVVETESEGSMFTSTFENTCLVLRSFQNKGENTTILGFGPDAYKMPKDFFPGISNMGLYGAHATISLHSTRLDEDTVLAYERGNGLTFIKIGADTLRVSKALAAGSRVISGYGWIEMDSPQGLPLLVVIGDRRDPLMTLGLRVMDMAASLSFFTNIGMKELPFQLARPIGSQFEPAQPPGSVYVGYSEDSLGLLLSPAAKGSTVTVGSQLRGITLIYDDSRPDTLPPAIRQALQEGSSAVSSPDGYPFLLKSYSQFNREAK